MPFDRVDMRRWFADDELELCPCCNEQSAVRTPQGGFPLCLTCGLLNADGERIADLSRAAEQLGGAAA